MTNRARKVYVTNVGEGMKRRRLSYGLPKGNSCSGNDSRFCVTVTVSFRFAYPFVVQLGFHKLAMSVKEGC